MSNISSTNLLFEESWLNSSQLEVKYIATPTSVKVALFVGGGVLFTLGMLAIGYSSSGSACFYLGSVSVISGVLMIGGTYLVHHRGQQRKQNLPQIIKSLQNTPPSLAKNLKEYEKELNTAKGILWAIKVPKYLNYYSTANKGLKEQTEKDVHRLDVYFKKELISDYNKLKEKINSSSIGNKEQAYNLCNQTILNEFSNIIHPKYISKDGNSVPLVSISVKKHPRLSVSLFNKDEKWYIRHQIAYQILDNDAESLKVFGCIHLSSIVDLQTGDAVVSWNSPTK